MSNVTIEAAMAAIANPQPMDIRQEATFAYLKQIQAFYRDNKALFQNNRSPYAQLEDTLKQVDSTLGNDKAPDPNKKYSRLYTRFQEITEKVAKAELKEVGKRGNQKLDSFFKQIYENDNKIHDKVASNVIHAASASPNDTGTKTHLDSNIKKNTTNPHKFFNITHPDNKLNAFFSSMIGFGYNPLKRNNVPYVAFDQNALSGGEKDQKCLRLGAQTQGEGEVNPTFKRYLLANARTAATAEKDQGTKNDFQYVYISLLKRGQEHQDTKKTGFNKLLDKFVRFSEGKRANALEDLNQQKHLKAAVITLPADGEFFLGDFSMKKGMNKDNYLNQRVKASELLDQLKSSIQNNKNDFYMSDAVKSKLFGPNCDNGKLDALFKQAMQDVLGKKAEKMGLETKMTQEQRSAVLFQFIKGNLSNHIINELNPKSYNMSCKDAIDRGGIHTLWHHMNLKHEQGKPMSEKDFHKFLDSPALIVKYRPLNDNRNLLWNALKHRMDADPKFKENHKWANDWLAKNAPPEVKKMLENSNKPALADKQQPSLTTENQNTVKPKNDQKPPVPSREGRPKLSQPNNNPPLANLLNELHQKLEKRNENRANGELRSSIDVRPSSLTDIKGNGTLQMFHENYSNKSKFDKSQVLGTAKAEKDNEASVSSSIKTPKR
jgi:hypothetical protein